ncbi:MAG: NTP transferase domain-containing protein [Bacteroidia bacterium]|nr:NTP transferase domain-containing protein [Bacteroidia bacterium]
MKTVILSGGEGRRMRDHSTEVPKPMVAIGGEPILWHIMQHYAHHGHTQFILCLGYKSEMITGYFVERFGGKGRYWEDAQYVKHLEFEEGGLPWQISFVYTGESTPTGGRIFRIRHLIEEAAFFATYADGLSDVDLGELLEAHQERGKIATLTAFAPTLQYGVLDLNHGDEVLSFREKPRLDMWINGGFFVFQREIFQYLADDHTLERETFRQLADENQLFAFKHHGFWKSMDTYKDYLDLEEMWEKGEKSWQVYFAKGRD